MIIPFFFKNAPRIIRENNIPCIRYRPSKFNAFPPFTLSHHSMMIPAFVLLPGALLPFGEPLPEGFSLPFSVSPVPEFPPGNAGEKPPDSASLLSRAFSFDACVPSGRLSCSETSFSCVSEALPVSFSDSSLPLPASWLSSAPLSCVGSRMEIVVASVVFGNAFVSACFVP